MTDTALAVDVRPRPADVAVACIPPGAPIRVHRDAQPAAGPVVYPVYGSLYVTIPGDRELLGWGATICAYDSIRGLRNNKHRRDRAVWHQAAAAVKDGGVVYVEHERKDYFGRPVWVAVRIRR